MFSCFFTRVLGDVPFSKGIKADFVWSQPFSCTGDGRRKKGKKAS